MIMTSEAMPVRYYILVIQVHSEAQGAWVDYKVLGIEGSRLSVELALARLEDIQKIQASYRFRLVRRLISDEVISYV